jgi:ADP-heptose:LPS heptosyltransferase
MLTPAPDRVLLVLLGAIGDVVRGLPLLMRVRRAWPKAHITWAVEPLSAPIVSGHPAIDEVIVFDRKGGAQAFAAFLRRIRAVRPDLTLDLQRHLKSGVTSRMSGARLRLGFARENSREGNWLFNNAHVPARPHYSSKLAHFLTFADWLELPPAPVEFGLRLAPEEDARAAAMVDGLERPYVAAFVGSSCESRLWFPDRTARVIEAVAAQGLDTVLLGGPGDVAFAADVEAQCGVRLRNLAGRTSLRDLFGIFARAAVAFGPDSGPMHIAAAVGAPVVSMWGATSAARSMPWGSEDGVLQGQADCMPCFRKTCPIGRVCMQTIAVEAAVERILAKRR